MMPWTLQTTCWMAISKVRYILKSATYTLRILFSSITDGKPEHLTNPEFNGSAIEALENHLIPFPYKVILTFMIMIIAGSRKFFGFTLLGSQMLGPLLLSKHWIRRLDCGKTWKSAQENRGIPFRSTVSYHSKFYESTYYKDFYSTIGNLPRGTPCAFRFQNFGQVYGFVQKPTINHKMIEVYIPVMDLCTYITRDQVMPLRSTPREIRALPRYPQDNNHRFQRSSCGGAVVSFFISNR